MGTLKVWYGMSPQIRTPVSKDTGVFSDEAFAANHQTIHEITQTLSVDLRDLKPSAVFPSKIR